MEPDIKNLVSDAIQAPSGENCQPWKFVVKGQTLELHNLPERDQSEYSWGQRASFMSEGACLENLSISASEHGYSAEIKLFPDAGKPNFVAIINLTKNPNAKKDQLYSSIKERATNRKAYDTKPLPNHEVEQIINSFKHPDVKILLSQDETKKRDLGKAGSLNEEIMFSNKYLHQFFFSHVNWTKEEDEQKKIGFFIDTLELPPPAKIGFKLFKHWWVTNLFNKLGLSKMVGKQNAQTNSSSSGFGIIVIKNLAPESFVLAGRALERIWLTATKLDLSLQPLTGILFFMYKVLAKETGRFSKTNIQAIKIGHSMIQEAFGVAEGEIISFMFRLGHGGQPSARSVRFTPGEVCEVKNN